MSPALATVTAVTALVLAAVLLLGVKALFVRGGSFPSGHPHDLPRLRRQAQERLERLRREKETRKNRASGL